MNELASPLPKLKKPQVLKTLSGIGGRREALHSYRLEEISRAKEDFHVDNAWEDRVARETGSRPLAKRVSRLRRKYPYGTVPELLALDWLEAKGERYIFQAQLYGGWRPGGLIPDFLLFRSSRAIAINIMGNHWHDQPGKRERDESDRLRMLGSTYAGSRIDKVVFVWENALVRNRDSVMENALMGMDSNKG
jgi:hypothetical protein